MRTPSVQLSSSTPVLVGVGQVAERLDEPGYLRRSPVDLAAGAARAALADAGLSAEAIDTVAGVRQFEISVPGAVAPLGRSDNFPRSVAGRIGATPRRAVLDVTGGQSPQHLVNEFAATIAAGGAEVVLLAGAEAISTVERYAAAPDRPDFSEHADGDLEDRGYGLDGIIALHHIAYGMADPATQYALFENARRARLGMTPEAYAVEMGRLFAPFTKVAAGNPYAAAPVERTAEELITPTAANRVVVEPYTRYLISRDKVNQGAAVLLTSVGAAERLGVPRERWVFLHGHADLRERDLVERADLSASPAAVMAARHALDIAGIGVDDLTAIDLYSCFPVPVFNVADGLGLAYDDPRGLTVTGGLPFFGGPGNNYSMHAIASVVALVRAGGIGFVGANGGMLSKYSVGIYSATPRPWVPDESARLQKEIDAWDAPVEADDADGLGTVETSTVKHRRDGGRTGIVLGRLDDGRRFLANGEAAIGDRVHVKDGRVAGTAL